MGRTLYHGPLTEEQKALAAHHFPLAMWMAGKWQERLPHLEQEIQSATHLGLVKAARAYQSHKGKFVSIAHKSMYREIRDMLRGYAIRMRRRQELLERVRVLSHSYFQDNGRIHGSD